MAAPGGSAGQAGEEWQPLPLSSFSNFNVDRVLSEEQRTKSIYLLGRFADKKGDAVVHLEKQHFLSAVLPKVLSSSTLQLTFQNDVYGKYVGRSADVDANAINATVIYPASEKHISKYSTQEAHMVRETGALYKAVTLPFITSIPPSRLQWVYNVLERKAEVERLLFEDEDPELGFMLHPDLKWDQTQVKDLYCLALVKRRDLRSLRDLRPEHLKLLRNVRAKSYATIQKHYGVPAKKLRSYIHYQPSYYHLHIHIAHVSFDAGYGMSVAKAHLLDDIIENLERQSDDYYANCTLHYTIGEKDPLWQAFEERQMASSATVGDIDLNV